MIAADACLLIDKLVNALWVTVPCIEAWKSETASKHICCAFSMAIAIRYFRGAE